MIPKDTKPKERKAKYFPKYQEERAAANAAATGNWPEGSGKAEEVVGVGIVGGPRIDCMREAMEFGGQV